MSAQPPSRLARLAWTAIVLAALAGAGVLTWRLVRGSTPPRAAAGGEAPPSLVRPASVYACARCHAIPEPSILPKSRWPGQLQRMAALIDQYQLGIPITEPELQEAVAYYVAGAPERLTELPVFTAPSPIGFQILPLGEPPDMDPEKGAPVLGHVAVVDLHGDGVGEVLVSDMRDGFVAQVQRQDDGSWVESRLADVPAPARTEVLDLDGDGDLDVAVASLGSVGPTEEPVGRVVFLLRQDDGTYRAEAVAEDLPRACDVRPADVDGDGDMDLLVATFGMYKTGGVGWLERRADETWSELRWIYRRNGVSHVPPADVDGDGRTDVVVMVSQEHEEIVALVNRGQGRFEQRQLYKAPQPMFGMSNLILTDLDRDGDPDVVFTNGDALDADPFPKPWHGVQWLHNLGPAGGEPRFELRDVGRFYGAYSVAAGDLDGDGDLDLAATSMMNQWTDPRRQAMVWFENDGRQGFTAHPVGHTPTYLVTSAVGDLDGDGRADLLAGGMNVMPGPQRPGRLVAWRNLGPAAP